jgi:alpha-D-ribose 1-methylphosphonate 5-triphosphate synthase subunit PhnG
MRSLSRAQLSSRHKIFTCGHYTEDLSRQPNLTSEFGLSLLQNSDDKKVAARQEWMALLAKAPLTLLETWGRNAPCDFVWLRRPEVGLAMVRARIGGTGDRFNLGELSVTRCALRLHSGEHGVAYVSGRSTRKAELVALADAMLQSADQHAKVEQKLLAAVRDHLIEVQHAAHRKAQATRVDFFTVARAGNGGGA